MMWKPALLCAAAAATLFAQAPAPPATTGGPPVRQRPTAYPQHPKADQAVLDRGKALYGVHCNFCHGSDARGGEGGPNLLRSELVLNDQNGEGLTPVIRDGRGDMPRLNLSPAQISDIAAFIHAFPVGGYDASRMKPPSIVVGDAKSGEAYFAKTCASCHSVTGDLKGIAGKIPDAKRLQQTWLMPGSGRGFGPPAGTPAKVTVILPNGSKTEGRLVRIDDFLLTLVDAQGNEQTISRENDSTKVDLQDPLQPHKDLLARYTDKDIHDVTAFLVTVK
jgi:cytochrome c oxidase cbb3-type subunit III